MTFKTLTTENWLEPDADGLSSLKIYGESEARVMNENDWLHLCQGAALHVKVPRNVRAHFEAARGALVYGYFYYPLCSLASEQLHHAAEWAVLQKCKETNCRIVDHRGRMIDIYRGLAWLRRIEIISKQEFHEWETIRKFRNQTIGPHQKKDQNLLAPGSVAHQFNLVAEKINALFK